MALRGALVDRARPVRKAATGSVVRGRSQFATVRGDWFRCRLALPGSPENLEGVTFRRSVIRVPTLMVDTRDVVGEPVSLTVEDRLEVSSQALGDGVWDVTSAAEPIRKKRRVIGWIVTLRRVEDAEFGTEAA